MIQSRLIMKAYRIVILQLVISMLNAGSTSSINDDCGKCLQFEPYKLYIYGKREPGILLR